MEYHENPEESREENEGEKKEEFSFMQETIKDETERMQSLLSATRLTAIPTLKM